MAKESEGVLSPRDVPDEYICSITFEIMEDPVFAMDGHSYERSAIEDWFTKNNRSPLTNEVIETRVVPNHNLKSIIAAYIAIVIPHNRKTDTMPRQKFKGLKRDWHNVTTLPRRKNAR